MSCSGWLGLQGQSASHDLQLCQVDLAGKARPAGLSYSAGVARDGKAGQAGQGQADQTDQPGRIGQVDLAG